MGRWSLTPLDETERAGRYNELDKLLFSKYMTRIKSLKVSPRDAVMVYRRGRFELQAEFIYQWDFDDIYYHETRIMIIYANCYIAHAYFEDPLRAEDLRQVLEAIADERFWPLCMPIKWVQPVLEAALRC